MLQGEGGGGGLPVQIGAEGFRPQEGLGFGFGRASTYLNACTPSKTLDNHP